MRLSIPMNARLGLRRHLVSKTVADCGRRITIDTKGEQPGRYPEPMDAETRRIWRHFGYQIGWMPPTFIVCAILVVSGVPNANEWGALSLIVLFILNTVALQLLEWFVRKQNHAEAMSKLSPFPGERRRRVAELRQAAADRNADERTFSGGAAEEL